MRFFKSIFAFLLLHPVWAAFYYPNPQVRMSIIDTTFGLLSINKVYLLEHILVDNWGAYASNFSSAITPCT